ncbi:hypothetical protein [endosymbiont 'TC1' of Trimyema compressum]|uniref:hypothetical protein n=1 Tax=endosymbiont 'TC1' of Trimyema compressum TaxID=243899 RepID=UPI001392435B|nr:hypothetical protein [endosymbiont 'TC1' of Trimyema compressum]
MYSGATVAVFNQEDINDVTHIITDKGYKAFSLNSIIDQLNIMLSAVKVILGGLLQLLY